LELTGYISNTTTRNTGRANALKLLFLVFFWTFLILLNFIMFNEHVIYSQLPII
jgi:hypothetical protein